MSLFNSFVSTLKQMITRTPAVQPVRFRYHAEKEANRHIRRFGYKDSLDRRGLLPHVARETSKLPVTYRPKNSWSHRRALFGQNDYIDILSRDDFHPSRIHYHLPVYMRAAKGNELQLLLRKRRALGSSVFPLERPSKWRDMNKQIKYLHKFLNQKTKTGFSRQ